MKLLLRSDNPRKLNDHLPLKHNFDYKGYVVYYQEVLTGKHHTILLNNCDNLIPASC